MSGYAFILLLPTTIYKNLRTTHDLYGISVQIYRYNSFKYHRLDIVKNTKNGIKFSRKWDRN